MSEFYKWFEEEGISWEHQDFAERVWDAAVEKVFERLEYELGWEVNWQKTKELLDI